MSLPILRASAAVLLLALALSCGRAAAADASLTLLWSVPAPGTPARVADGWTVEDAAAHEDGSLALLARERAAAIVVAGGGASGAGNVVFSDSGIALSRIANARGNALWLGGRINPRADASRTDAADAYLTRIDRAGSPYGEYVFHSGRYRAIEDLYALPDGDVLASGRDGDATWLARISEAGAMRWQQRFGIAKASAIGMIGGRIVVAAFEASADTPYREDIAVWAFETDGKPGGKHVVTPGFTDARSTRATLAIVGGSEATYLVTASTDGFRPRYVDVSRLAADGSTMGHVALTQTLVQRGNRTLACEPAPTVLDGGDLLVACALDAEIRIYRLAASDAQVSELSVPLPACQRAATPALFLTRGANRAVWLVGSSGGNTLAAACTWLATLSVE